MTGTLLNVAAVLVGGLLGMALGSRLPEQLRRTVVAGLGLFVLAFGARMFLQTENALVVLISLLIGILLGEWWRIEDRLHGLGVWLEQRFARADNSSGRFVRGFMVASLLFCIGPMAVLGSIQDGLTGNYETLAVKSILDGFAALAFASSLGIGVLFSTLPVFAYQGGISLLAAQVDALLSEAMLAELTATGGVILMGIAISNLLEIKQIRVGNFLPALVAAPFVVVFFIWLGIYP